MHSTAPDDRMEFYLVVDNATFVFIQFINCKKKIIDSAPNVSQFIYRRQLQHFFSCLLENSRQVSLQKPSIIFHSMRSIVFVFVLFLFHFFFTNDLSLNFHQKKKKVYICTQGM